MGNYSENSDDSPETAAAVPGAASPTTTLERFAETVLDTVAGMLRDYGTFGFDTEVMDSVELEQFCDEWARHILTGSPVPLHTDEMVEQESPEPIHLYDRSLPDMHRFFANIGVMNRLLC